jgi:hypothetical protein
MSGSARRLGKFCLCGLLLGVGLSCALLLASDLTGQKLWNDSGFGRMSRVFWPAAFMFGILDVDVDKSVILTLFAIAIGANQASAIITCGCWPDEAEQYYGPKK